MAVVTIYRLVVSERHALAGDNDRHALERHDERNDDGEQANQPQTHERSVLQMIGRGTGRGVPCEEVDTLVSTGTVGSENGHHRRPQAVLKACTRPLTSDAMLSGRITTQALSPIAKAAARTIWSFSLSALVTA